MLQGLFAVMLLVGEDRAALQQTETFHIAIHVIRFDNLSAMRSACNQGLDDIHGCTHFVGEALTASCSEDRGVWSLAVRGHALALVRVPALGLDVVHHELEHVRDIRESADGIIARATAASHGSRERCEAAAASLRARFRGELQEAARASNARRN